MFTECSLSVTGFWTQALLEFCDTQSAKNAHHASATAHASANQDGAATPWSQSAWSGDMALESMEESELSQHLRHIMLQGL
jgi:hypothetical protein